MSSKKLNDSWTSQIFMKNCLIYYELFRRKETLGPCTSKIDIVRERRNRFHDSHSRSDLTILRVHRLRDSNDCYVKIFICGRNDLTIGREIIKSFLGSNGA